MCRKEGQSGLVSDAAVKEDTDEGREHQARYNYLATETDGMVKTGLEEGFQ